MKDWEEESKELKTALDYLVAYADRTQEYWDQPGNDHKVGKRLSAMAGHLPGYDAGLDSLHALLASAK